MMHWALLLASSRALGRDKEGAVARYDGSSGEFTVAAMVQW